MFAPMNDADASETLIWKALCALDEVAEQSRRAPITPTAAIRFALAYLYAHVGSDRPALVEFYQTIQFTNANDDGHGAAATPYTRGTMACTLLHGIARSVGVNRQAPNVCTAMRQMWERRG